jgi:hypothetical protein
VCATDTSECGIVADFNFIITDDQAEILAYLNTLAATDTQIPVYFNVTFFFCS